MSEARNAAVEPRAAVKEAVEFRGHRLVRSTHPTTIEITTEDYLTENGDCIIGVGASKGCAGLSAEVKDGLRRAGSVVDLRINVDTLTYSLRASGDPRLTLTDPHDMVIRCSDFVSDRTLAVRADAASRDIPREMVRLLRNPSTKGKLEIEVT